MTIIDPLPAGAFTLSGKTQGPAIGLGRNRHARGQLMFMHRDELRDACAAFGWASDKEHAKVVAALDAANLALKAASALNVELEAKVATLEKAIGWKPEPPAAPPAPAKPRKPSTHEKREP